MFRIGHFLAILILAGSAGMLSAQLQPVSASMPHPVNPPLYTVPMEVSDLWLEDGDQQLFRVALVAGKTYQANVDCGKVDSLLEIFEPDQLPQTDQARWRNDDFAPRTLCSRVTFVAEQTGRHFVKVEGFAFTAPDHVSLSLREIELDDSGVVATRWRNAPQLSFSGFLFNPDNTAVQPQCTPPSEDSDYQNTRQLPLRLESNTHHYVWVEVPPDAAYGLLVEDLWNSSPAFWLNTLGCNESGQTIDEWEHVGNDSGDLISTRHGRVLRLAHDKSSPQRLLVAVKAASSVADAIYELPIHLLPDFDEIEPAEHLHVVEEAPDDESDGLSLTLSPAESETFYLTRGDRDTFTLDLAAGQLVAIETFCGFGDTALTVRDPQGRVVLAVDDVALSRCASARFAAAASGTYSLEVAMVGWFDDDESSAREYRLRLRDLSVDG